MKELTAPKPEWRKRRTSVWKKAVHKLAASQTEIGTAGEPSWLNESEVRLETEKDFEDFLHEAKNHSETERSDV